MADLSLIGKVLRVQVLGWRKLLTFNSRFDIPVDGPPGSPQFRSTDRRVGDVAQIIEQIAERIGEAKGTMSLRVES